MMARGELIAVLVCCAAATRRVNTAGSDSPVAKVIELLQENKMKVKNDLDAESKEMAEYADFCDSEISEKTYAIKTGTRKLAELNAAILEGTAQVSTMDDSIATIGSQMLKRNSSFLQLL